MELNEALEIAKQDVHRLRAYQKLEEMLTMVHQSEGTLPIIAKRKEELAQLTEKISGMQADFEKKTADYDGKYKAFCQDIREKTDKIQHEFNAKSEALSSDLNELSKAKEASKKEYIEQLNEQESEKKSKLSELDFLIAEEETKLANTKKALEAIKAKI